MRISFGLLAVVFAMTLLSTRAQTAETAAAPSADTAAWVNASGQPGGLALVLGAKDLALAKDLARSGRFYVQVLQPDAKTALQWGLEIANGKERENAGIRSAAFNPEHYGTDLFNLVVVEDAAALGKVPLADLCRILVPRGVAVFRDADASLEGAAKTLKMEAVAVAGFKAAFRKPVVVPEWNPCDSVKWRAGARAQHCASFTNVEARDGKLNYWERMEVPCDINASVSVRTVRDAYNGRVLETEELKDAWPRGRSKTLNAKPPAQEEFDKTKFGNSCFPPIKLGKYILYHHNIWINSETKERIFPYLAHPACFMGQVPADGIVYNFPSRKGGCLEGISAIAPADIPFDYEPGGKVLVKLGEAPAGAAAPKTDDWPMFRANAERGNFVAAAVGPNLAKVWETQVSLGGKPFGLMCAQRTGISQPVVANGMVYVSDLDAQRVVALDAASGQSKWVFPVGSRVEFSPAIYNGLCLFTAKDGWVYALDARTGAPVWKLLIPSHERYIGGQDKLESLWPTVSDVLVVNGVGYASAGWGFTVLGGARAVAFKPETGEVIWRQCYTAELPKTERQSSASFFVADGAKGAVAMAGRTIDPKTGAMAREFRPVGVLRTMGLDDYLAYGNSISRTSEDRAAEVLADGRVSGRTIAFGPKLAVAYSVSWGAEGWNGQTNKKVPVTLTLSAAAEPGTAKKPPVWSIPNIELIADDIVLTEKYAFVAGHYQRVKKDPELWVVSLEDGKTVSTLPIEGFPAFIGMSAAGNRLYLATREGKLICLEGK